ncbi:peptide ABC transporter permease [Streptomyces spiroverticillatus]|uniref:Peptide ABC transporter permease n=1 Tax=Streptomyces finlayi TaxID=67296 RepID=A0A918WS92_9ACTN|nr:ABC transporter permease [Streptomyces finlayi]GGZ86082.1 peptide ABC transporter permease [Streptomyces spiroverticillatus]GHC77588.1 peptide ABC transporter permease [Streptomyces finlayi]
MPDVTKSKTDAAVDAIAPPAADAAPEAPVAKPSTGKPRSLWGDAWFDLRHRPMFWTAAVMLFVLLVIAAFPGLFTSADPRAGDLTNHYLTKPELGHFFQADWFGYDIQGRSIYARVIHGTRASILVGVGVTLAITLIGGLLGLLSGYFGGWIDSIISRITDIFFGLPFLLGTMVVLNAFTERKVYVVIAALAFLGWTSICRVMRASVISAKQADYVTAARALGAGTSRMIFRHVLPNALAPTIVVATIALGGFISAEATLSYLGLGLADPTISWGIDISAGSEEIRNNLHVLIFPAGMLFLTVFAFIMLGDTVRDALDPKLR